jgi:hypothetical protein
VTQILSNSILIHNVMIYLGKSNRL